MKDSKVEEMEISFLLPFSAYPPTYISPKETCDLLEDIEKNGILEPAVLSINPFTNLVRLDSGNHRVRILPVIGITSLPTIGYVTDVYVPTPTNGLHNYYCDLIKYDVNLYKKPFYCKPSSVLDIGDYR